MEVRGDWWQEFLGTPIAELWRFGADQQTINIVEERYGIYVRDVQGVEFGELAAVENVNHKRAMKFARSLIRLASELSGEPLSDGLAGL